MPELDRIHEIRRQEALNERASAVERVRAQIVVALVPVVDEAKTRIALKTDEDGRFRKTYQQHLQDKHPLHGLSFFVRSTDTLDWLSDQKLESWVRGVIEENTLGFSRMGLQDHLTSRGNRFVWTSWRKFGFVPMLQISGRFDYYWYESAPR
jgi:hypothetical protein